MINPEWHPQDAAPSTDQLGLAVRSAASRRVVRMDDWDPRFAPFVDTDLLPRVVSRADALRRGLSRYAIDRRLASGRWRRVLPRTYLTTQTMTWLDRVNAALIFAGDGALISGEAALALAGMRGPARPSTVLVLVPPSNRVDSSAWVRIRRTSRPMGADLVPGPARVEVARAVADHALASRRLDDVRALVTRAVRERRCTVADLARELEAGPRRGSAFLRQAIDETSGGAWSAPEARAASVLRRARVPRFEQNAVIPLPGGGHFVADFLWRRLRAVLEIDSREHHFEPADWRATMDRHLALETLGYSVVHRPPSAAFVDPRGFAADISAWLTARAAALPQSG
jgi:very-short-patch-repair endonuclease